MQKLTSDADWSWQDSLGGFSPGTFSASTSFQDWAEGLDASSSYNEEGASCLEIMPYTPKVWNPFSCEVRNDSYRYIGSYRYSGSYRCQHTGDYGVTHFGGREIVTLP